MHRFVVISTYLLPLVLVETAALAASRIDAYAQQCSAEIGVEVPAFNCWDGEPIPGQNSPNWREHTGSCANPSFFNNGKDCRPGTFQVLVDDGDVFITAICRKGPSLGSDTPGYERFADIAVIQTRRSTGATCFFQRPENNNFGHDPQVLSPHDPTQSYSYYASPSIVGICTQCHDGSALLRSPHVTSITYDGRKFGGFDSLNRPVFVTDPNEQSRQGQRVLPSGNVFNAPGSPYWVVGESAETAKFQPVSISTPENTCTTCHTLGAKLSIDTQGADAGTILPLSFTASSGSMAYSTMSVLPTSVLSTFSPTMYTALDPAVEKWWMPAGRTSIGVNGDLTDFFVHYASASHVESCKVRLIEENGGNLFLETGYVYPQDEACWIEPRPKAHRFDNDEPFSIVSLFDDTEGLVEPGPGWVTLGTPTPSDPGSRWIITPASSGVRYIVNESTGRVLCADAAGGLYTCASQQIFQYASQWRVEIFNDYAYNAGIPSGRSFRIANLQLPNQYLVADGALELAPLAAQDENLDAVWRFLPE